jgi:hypothetical protein
MFMISADRMKSDDRALDVLFLKMGRIDRFRLLGAFFLVSG